MPQGNTHHLKTWPEYFQAVKRGEKTFEIRLDDRGYVVGDNLVLEEFDPATALHTGEVILAKVSYVLYGGRQGFTGVQPGYALLALSEVRHHES